jgi:hypothetical protein
MGRVVVGRVVVGQVLIGQVLMGQRPSSETTSQLPIKNVFVDCQLPAKTDNFFFLRWFTAENMIFSSCSFLQLAYLR